MLVISAGYAVLSKCKNKIKIRLVTTNKVLTYSWSGYESTRTAQSVISTSKRNIYTYVFMAVCRHWFTRKVCSQHTSN